MSKRLKFRPEITRVKLNPEQAVLACTCIDAQRYAAVGRQDLTFCTQNVRGWTGGSSAKAVSTASVS